MITSFIDFFSELFNNLKISFTNISGQYLFLLVAILIFLVVLAFKRGVFK